MLWKFEAPVAMLAPIAAPTAAPAADRVAAAAAAPAAFCAGIGSYSSTGSGSGAFTVITNVFEDVPSVVVAVTSIVCDPVTLNVPLKISDDTSNVSPVGSAVEPYCTAVIVRSRPRCEQNGPTEKLITSSVIMLLSSRENGTTSWKHNSVELKEYVDVVRADTDAESV